MFFNEVPIFIVFNETIDSKFLDIYVLIAKLRKFVSSPEDTIVFDFTNFGFKSVQSSIVYLADIKGELAMKITLFRFGLK